MALPATNIWEVEHGGADTSGGGFDPANANMLTDGAATVANTTAPVFTSASYNFVAGDAGAWLFIQSGTNWTPGWYKISSVGANAATLDATIGHATLYSQLQVNTAAGCATVASPTAAVWSIDYSQQAAPQFSYADMTSAGANSNALQSVAHPFGQQQVGNTIQLASGTNVTAGFYTITSVSGVTATVAGTANATGAGGAMAAGVGKQGGALLTVSEAVNTAMIGSNLVAVQYNAAAFTVTATLTPPAGANDKPSVIFGYTTVRGDITGPVANMPAIQISSGSFNIISMTNVVGLVKNLILDCNSAAASRSISGAGTQWQVDNVVCKGFTDFGCVPTGGSFSGSRILCVSNGTGASAGLYAGADTDHYHDCAAVGLTCKGMRMDGKSTVERCVFANNSGATSDGIDVNVGQGPFITNCSLYGNGRDGLRLDVAGASNALFVLNNILAKNTGAGIDNNTGTSPLRAGVVADYNFFWSNTAGARTNFPAGTHDVIGTGDPFVNPAGSVTTLADVWTNFALNNTAGAGAACRGAGYP